MEFRPNYKRLGIDNAQDAIKYVLSYIKKHRKGVLDTGLGSAWKQGDNKHPETPELYEAVFVLGGRMFFLQKNGFSDKSLTSELKDG